MTADELYRIRAFICDADRVEKEPLALLGARAAGIILGFDVDPDVSCGGFGRRHSISYVRLPLALPPRLCFLMAAILRKYAEPLFAVFTPPIRPE